jgi:isohexenylglutaconyl-CoA hydratase
MQLPQTTTLTLRLDDGILHLTLNRPERKNAMNTAMIDELSTVFDLAQQSDEVRAVVLRGAGGTFCAGADIKDIAKGGGGPGAREGAQEDGGDRRAASVRGNRRFGAVTERADALDKPLVAVVEGAAMGGGFGLVCVSDVALAAADARFGVPETTLGLVPAQIAPFVVARIGLTHARRLALTGARIDATEARRLGVVHEVFDDGAALDAALARTLDAIRGCAPKASVATKRLLRRCARDNDLSANLDHAAELFADAVLGDEAPEGTRAFVERRPPRWK